ncbi:MAG: SGNH/GDSL hydrolase family protein [Gemmatimonadaceae bacterium]
MSRTQTAFRGAIALGALAGLGAMAACNNDATVVTLSPANPLFQSYVAIGNSITAGFQSDGINDSTQRQAYPALLARAMGTRYAYPSLALPGCRPPLNNFLTQSRLTLAGQPASTAATCAYRSNFSIGATLNNVAVPGITSADPSAQVPTAQAGNPLNQIILGGESMVQKALDAHPTFATVWAGNNDILSYAIQGLSPLAGAPTTQANFVANYAKMINQLVAGAPGVKGVLIGVVQVGGAPVMVAAPAFANPAFQAGINQATGQTITYDPGCATSTSLIGFPLIAQIKAKVLPPYIVCSKTSVIPVPPPIGDIFVLDAAEQVQVAGIVNGYNAYIKAKADSIGFAYYDPNTTLTRLAGLDPILASHVPNIASATAPFGQYVTLDGIHPSAAAHIQIANDLIAVINAKYGTSLAPAG